MAAIGTIRKWGFLLVLIIFIPLIAFVLGDVSKLSVFSDKYTMVKINGTKFDDEYRIRLDQNTALWKIFYEKSTLEETEIYQVHDMTWNQLLDQTILDQQLKNLGLSFTQEMIEENAANMVVSLQTQQPNQLLYRLVQFIAQRNVSMEQAIGFIANIEEYKNEPNVRDIYNAYKAIERFALIDLKRERYMVLTQNSITFSDEAAKYFATNNKGMLVQAATFFPTATQFNEIEVTVLDKEIQNWFKNHKERYEIKNNARDIDVAIFPIQPSPEDLTAIEDTVMNRYTRLREAISLEDFNISMMSGPLDSIYFKRDDIQIDTLVKLIFDRPVGAFVEPFEHEGIVWFYGKTYGAAKRPDSILVACLVVDFKTERNPTATRTKKEAKALADSLKNVLHKGGNVFALTPEYLGGRKATDTTLWYSEHTIDKKLFNGLLHQNFYIDDISGAFIVYQVMERTTLLDKRLFVMYSEEIKPSDATIKSIKSQATQLQAESNSAEDLMTNAAQNGIQAIQGKDLTSMMSSISQFQNVREIVSWAFNPNTKVDDVSDVYNINGNFFVVAAVRAMKTKGEPKLEDVREAIETELKTLKKLELVQNTIAEQLNSGTSIQQIAEKYQVNVMDSIKLTFGGESYQNRGIENTAIGKIFALPLGKASAVSGKNNVYAVSVYEIDEPTEPSPNFTMEKTALKNAVAGRSRSENIILETLKDKANILDQRYLYFQR